MKFLRGLNQFLVGILCAVFLGWLLAAEGASGGLFRTEFTTKLAVFLIFLSQGLTLPSEEIKTGFLQWRFHLFSTVFIFVFFPGVTFLVLVVLDPLFSGRAWWTADLQMGFYFLAILPTTITTAVVYTGKSGGNVSAALFSTAFTNIAGIFIVPLAGLALAGGLGFDGEGEGFAAGPTILKILLLLFLPFVLGQALRPWLKFRVDGRKALFRNINVYLVYFIVFAAFANSFHNETWAQYPPIFLFITVVLTLILLVLFSGTAWLFTGWFGFSPAERIAGFFCASQKTLAAGIPLAGSLFVTGRPEIGLVILPLMAYHPLQLILHGYFVGRWEKGLG